VKVAGSRGSGLSFLFGKAAKAGDFSVKFKAGVPLFRGYNAF